MKNLFKQYGIFLVLCVVALHVARPDMVFAQAAPESLNVREYLTTTGQENQPFNIASLIVRVISFLSLSIGSFAFLAIVIGGIFMVTAGGRENQIQRGKDIIKYAVIGLIVAFSAYFITTFVQSVFFEYGTTE